MQPLFLVIHAPRRGIIEVWKMRNKERIAMMYVGNGCHVSITTFHIFAMMLIN
jgi:hypothetical protein